MKENGAASENRAHALRFPDRLLRFFRSLSFSCCVKNNRIIFGTAISSKKKKISQQQNK